MAKNKISQFTHLDLNGKVKMVDISNKTKTFRMAIAKIEVIFPTKQIFKQIIDFGVEKGDLFTTSKISAIFASKKTCEIIPLCHQLNISLCDVKFDINHLQKKITIFTLVKTNEATGVEMEAIFSAQVAATTIYDMCKAIAKNIIISNCVLLYKSGGKSGEFKNAKEFKKAYEKIADWLK